MDFRSCRNLAAMFFAQAERLGDKPFIWSKQDAKYRPISWRQAASQARALARGLRALGIAPGDHVGLVSESRPEWVIADFAIMATGAATVPSFTTNTIEDHRHVFADSCAKAVIVSTNALAHRVMAAADPIAGIRNIVTIDTPVGGSLSHAELHLWSELIERGRGEPDDIAPLIDGIDGDSVACLIYTSGTGGIPKGVMLTHGNILSNCRGVREILAAIGIDDEVFLSFLPLSHSYEHTAGLMFPVLIGAQIYFAEGADTLAANLLEARPTIMTAVPRLYEGLHQRLTRAVSRETPLKRRLFDLTLQLGHKRLEAPEALHWWERLLDRLLDGLVRAKIRTRFGGRLKAMVSGGAPLNPEIGRFFIALGVRLLQGYGQTESAPVVSFNPLGRVKVDTVGKPITDTEIRIADDGEILVRGPQVMKGYWHDPEATAHTLRDGWLHTGDVGDIDADGYLRITDRKRDFIKNSGGDMISPARVEGYLGLEPEITQAMVFGDRRPYLVAVIVPDPDFLAHFAASNGKERNLAALTTDSDLCKAIGAAVTRVNRELSPIERVRRFILADEPFTTANGQMTPTLKIRRHAIRAVYGEALQALYDVK